MKTTIELPDELLRRAKIEAVRQRTSLKKLMIEGLEHVLGNDGECIVAEDALDRLRKGYRLGGKPLDREDTHAR